MNHGLQAKVFKVWPEIKWKKKRVMKAQHRENKRHKNDSFGLMYSGRMYSIQPEKYFQNVWEVEIKSSSLAELRRFLQTTWVFELAQYGEKTPPTTNRLQTEVTEPFNVPIICDNCNIFNDAGAASCLGAALVRFENPHLFTTDWFGSFVLRKLSGPAALWLYIIVT